MYNYYIMFHWRIIIILIIIKILSSIIAQYYTNNKKHTPHTDYQHKIEQNESEEESKICITPAINNFMMCWVKFTIEIIDYSRAIIQKYPNENTYYNNLEKTKDELITLFYEINQGFGDKFKNLINQQIIYKINLCNAIVNNNTNNFATYSEKLKTNTSEFGNLFVQIKKNKQNTEKLKSTMDAHTNTYIKSAKLMKDVTNSELTRELVTGSIQTVKLLF